MIATFSKRSSKKVKESRLQPQRYISIYRIKLSDEIKGKELGFNHIIMNELLTCLK
jgi:hypothetical protein